MHKCMHKYIFADFCNEYIMAILCFSGDPFQSTSDFDLELADDGGRSVTLCFLRSSFGWREVYSYRII